MRALPASDAALAIVAGLAAPVGRERVAPDAAGGRVVAEHVHAISDAPPAGAPVEVLAF